MTDEILDFLIKYKVNISTSLDGDKELHNQNRVFQNGTDTFDTVIKQIKHIQRKGYYVGAIQTTTKQSLNKAKEIIDTYVDLGQTSIFIRPLTRLGTAKEYGTILVIHLMNFLSFMKKVCDT